MYAFKFEVRTIKCPCVGFGWLVDDVWACAIAELVMGVDI